MKIISRFHRLPMQIKLPLLISIVVLLSGLSIYFVVTVQYKQTIMAESVKHLNTIRENRIREIRMHLEQQMYNLDTLAAQPVIKRALSEYKPADFGSSTTSPSFLKADKLLGSYLSYYRQKSGYYDMFLISPGGDIFFTLAREHDLGTNLVSGKYRDTQLANVFHHASFLLQAQISAISYYAPSAEAAKFLITPVFDHSRVAGFVAIQMNLSALDEVITSITGLGRTGEVVAGILKDKESALLVAPLRHAPEAAMNQSIELGSERARPLQRALQGQLGNASSIDYRGIAVEAAWGYVPEMELGVVVKMDRDELLQPVAAMQQSVIIIVMLILALTIMAAAAFSRSITTPIKTLKAITTRYAKGQFDVRSILDSHGEIGQLSAAFNVMADNIKNYHSQIHEKNKELKAYGDQLEQRVEERTATLTAANEEIKSFAYIVSHDLRSPLVNMRGFTGELDYALNEISKKIEPLLSSLKENDRQQMQQLFEEDIPESMQFITSSVEKMDHMLSAILTLSRLGRRELNIESVDLHALCDSVVNSLAYQIEKSHTVLKLGYLPVIDNDRLVMEQIMANLIGNAIKYLNPDRPGNIEISSKLSDSGITIAVRDNGHGILPQEEEKVFQIFRRGVHQDVEGEGMGLPYVQTLVRAQGGNISFEPAPDCGTIFAVFLPFQNRGGKCIQES
jgi:signal transduction histidine kinase